MPNLKKDCPLLLLRWLGHCVCVCVWQICQGTSLMGVQVYKPTNCPAHFRMDIATAREVLSIGLHLPRTFIYQR